MNINRHIIIDCDPGTDDALALYVASLHIRESVLAVLSSYGNSTLTNTHANLLGLGGLLSLECEYLRGAAAPLGKDSFIPTDYHGENGLCGIVLPPPTHIEEHTNGIARAAELLSTAGPITWIALGPLTNLASLLNQHPDAIYNIEEIIIMGGGLAFGNVPSGAEYNFSLDPHAVDAVFACPVQKTLVPLDLTHTLAFSEAEVEQITGAAASELRWETLLPRDVFGEIFFRNLSSAQKNGHDGAIIHDAATLCYLLCPEACTARQKRLTCDALGRIAESENGYPVNVVTTMKKSAMAMLLKE